MGHDLWRMPPISLPLNRIFAALLLATMLAAVAGPGAAFAQSCTGQCLLDRLFQPINTPAADQGNSTGKSADREASPLSWSPPKRASTESTPRWTVSAEAIGLGRMGGVNQTLVARVPGNVQFYDTSTASGVEAFNSNQFQGFSAGPRISIIYHGDSGYGAELSYFNIFNQGATKAIGPDSPADWLVMKAPGTLLANAGFPVPGHGMEIHHQPLQRRGQRAAGSLQPRDRAGRIPLVPTERQTSG